MELIVKQSQARCPVCAGLVRELLLNTLYKCNDCEAKYQVTAKGYAEDALEVEIAEWESAVPIADGMN